MNSYRGDGSQHHRHKCGDDRYDKGVLYRCKQRCVALHVAGQQVLIQLCREACPVAKHLALCEGEYGNEDQRGVHHNKQHPYIGSCNELFHTLDKPSFGLLLVFGEQ